MSETNNRRISNEQEDKMSETKKRQIDWENLDMDIHKLIFCKLSADPRYYFRFQAVCKKWCSFINSLKEPPSRFPWLLDGKDYNKSTQAISFYSVATKETGTMKLPEDHSDMQYKGPGYNTLMFLTEDRRVSLLNPLTRAQMLLPEFDDTLEMHYLLPSNLDGVQSRICVLADVPDTDEEDWAPSVYNPDTQSWNHIIVHAEIYEFSCSTCCWMGKLFATSEARATVVHNARLGERLFEVTAPADESECDESVYLIEACGTIWRVTRYFHGNDGSLEAANCRFRIYELVTEGEVKNVIGSMLGGGLVT